MPHMYCSTKKGLRVVITICWMVPGMIMNPPGIPDSSSGGYYLLMRLVGTLYCLPQPNEQGIGGLPWLLKMGRLKVFFLENMEVIYPLV